MASHIGVSVTDAVDSFSSNGVISTWSARSPSASSSNLRTSVERWPGKVRMSTSTSTRSGITLVFVPPWTTVGAIVVCVHAVLARETDRQRLAELDEPVLVEEGRLHSGPKSTPSMNRRHVSWMCAGGWNVGRPPYDLGQVTSALSVRNGCDADRACRTPRCRHPQGALLADDDRQPRDRCALGNLEAHRLRSRRSRPSTRIPLARAARGAPRLMCRGAIRN